MNKNKIYMYIGLFILLVSTVGSIGTYAYFTWSSTNNTSVTLSIGELADVTYTTGPDIKVENLSPVYNYTDGVYTTFNITNRDTTSNLLYTVKLNITSIDTELQDKTFKYVLLENDKIVSQDNFENAQNNTTLTLYTGELDKATLSKSATSTYKLYFYIDGNEENNPNMMNKSLIGKIDVTIEEMPIPLAEYITNLYTNAEKSTVTNNSITYNYASSESLMNDRLGGTTSLDGGNIRYYGASPNNYIYFNCETYPDTNCELWRIIGVFDGKVKIMRNYIIGDYSWDNSGSYGINDWTTAWLMKLLNPGYESESVEGSLYYNSKSGTCYQRQPFEKDGDTYYASLPISCDFTSSGIKNDVTRSKIAEATWNLGGSDVEDIYSNQFYEYERGTTVYSGHSTLWTGKIALAYPSDYGYAADFNLCSKSLRYYGSSACIDNNWMKSIYNYNDTINGWLLTPWSNDERGVRYIGYGGSIQYNPPGNLAGSSNYIVPTLFLNSTETIYGNNNDSSIGTESNPYKLNP